MHNPESSTAKARSRRWLVHLALVAALGLLAYTNSFSVPFQFDDGPFIENNFIVKDLSNFIKFPERAGSDVNEISRSRYVSFLAFALNYAVHGLNVWGYHAVNLLIHVLNAFLVYTLVLLSFRTPRMARSSSSVKPQHIALVASLLFVAHPVQSQAVTYIAQRFASLATLFYLCAMTGYIKARLDTGRGRWGWYAAAVLSALLAMKSKEIAATLPLAIVLYEFMFLEGRTGKRLLLTVPFFLAVAIIPLSIMDLDRPLGALIGDVHEPSWTYADMSRSAYLLTQFRVITTYIRLLLLPVNQTLEYDFPRYDSIGHLPVVLSLLFLASVLASGVLLLRRSRHPRSAPLRLAAFGVFFFFLALMVESSIIPIVDIIFEHRMYLPLAGASVCFATGLLFLVHTTGRKGTRRAALLFVVLLPLVLASATYVRNTQWQSRKLLWEDVIQKAPGKARGYSNLGLYYYEVVKDMDRAKVYYRRAVENDPSSPEVHRNMGIFYLDSNDLEKAQYHLKQSLSRKMDSPEAHSMLALVYARKGQYDRAMQHFSYALSLDPTQAEVYYNRGLVFASRGNTKKAIGDLERATALKPEFAEAHDSLGTAYFMTGKPDLAKREFLAAIRANPGFPGPYNNLGIVLTGQGRFNEATGYLKEAVRLNPGFAQAHLNLAKAYIRAGQTLLARRELNEALAIDPDMQEARQLLEKL